MMSGKYISIPEFAKRAGVSKQSVYQRSQGVLKKYVKESQGQKVINTKALEEVYGIKLDQDLTTDSQVEKTVDAAVIELLKNELAAKDRQIEKLQDLLDHEQQLHAATVKRLTVLEQRYALEANPDPEEAPSQSTAAEVTKEAPAIEDDEGSEPTEELTREKEPEYFRKEPEPLKKKKKSFFGRIFRKEPEPEPEPQKPKHKFKASAFGLDKWPDED